MKSTFCFIQSHLLLVILAVGIILRIGFFISDKNIWRDEANLLLAIQETEISDLGLEMPYGQRIPVGVGIVFKWLIQFGLAEWIRFPSLVAGIMSLVIFKSLLGQFAVYEHSTPFTLGLFAFSPQLILFSNQAKAYGFDVFFTVLLLFYSLSLCIGTWDRRNYFSLFLCSIGAVLFSLTSVFTIGAIVLVIFVKHRMKRLLECCFLASVPALLFFFLYMFRESDYSYLDTFWNDFGKFASLNPMWWIEALFVTFFNAVWFPSFRELFFPVGAFLALVAGTGVVLSIIRRSHGYLLAVLLIPIALVLGASCLKIYPYAGRLIIFSVPLVILLVGHGLKLVNGIRFGVGLSYLANLVVFLLMLFCVVDFFQPQTGFWEDVRFIKSDLNAEDCVLTDLYESQIINYYRSVGEFDHGNVVHEWANETTQSVKNSLDSVVSGLAEDKRIWFLVASVDYHRSDTSEIRPEARQLLKLLSMKREMLKSRVSARSSVYLFSEVKRDGS